MKKMLFFLLAAGMMTACSNDGPESPETPQVVTPEVGEEEPVVNEERSAEVNRIELTANEAAISEAYGKFGLSLFQRVLGGSDCAENVMLSPYTANVALSMLLNGAVDETYDEIVSTMGIGSFSLDEINAFNSKILEKMPLADGRVEMITANSLWTTPIVMVNRQYVATLADTFFASHFNVSEDEMVQKVNAWIEKETKGYIKNLLDDKCDLALVDAMYFKSPWGLKFDKEKTVSGSFTNADGSVAETDFMCQGTMAGYSQDESGQYAQLPFGGGLFNFTVFLPSESAGTLELTSEVASKIASPLTHGKDLKLQLPKFKLDNKLDLLDVLKEMGMEIATSGEAQFTKIDPRSAKVTKVLQGNAFSIDEDGGTGASATIIGMDLLATPEYKPQYIDFVVNRPFLFAVTEQSTGTILFLGKVSKL